MSRMYGSDFDAMTLMAALALASRNGGRTRRAAQRTPEQIAAADQRTDRQRWNDEVEAKKLAKLAAKGKA